MSAATVNGLRVSCVGEQNHGLPHFRIVKVDLSVAKTLIPCPVSLHMDFPFATYKTTPEAPLSKASDFDNQLATWLNIEIESGFAPGEWQSGVGPIVFVRTDGEDVKFQDWDIATNVVSDLLDLYAENVPFDRGDVIQGLVQKWNEETSL